MTITVNCVDKLPGVFRIENCSKDDLTSMAMEMTHAVYPHDHVYGEYCPIQDYVNCPPEKAFEYLADVNALAEWTYSLRDVQPAGNEGLYVGRDRIGSATKIFVKVIANRQAMTVDFHCAWDQGEHLWMIYLMRVVPAQLVLNKPGCVVIWTNCRHPFYDHNPNPKQVPAGRKIWVGDMWPYFYAGHKIELGNLKQILEHRHAQGLPMTSGGAA